MTANSNDRQRAVMAAHINNQSSRVFNVSKHEEVNMTYPPPSTPSPTHPFVHLDSTSTASVSHLAPQSHASAHDAHPLNLRCTSTDSQERSLCASHATSPSQRLPDIVSQKRVSLEQHLQHGDVGREEAMQSFILERFLPAAKTVAADHDHTMHSSVGRHPIAATSSTIHRHSSSTKKVAPLHSNKSSLTLNDVAQPGHFSHNDDGYAESVNGEMPGKSCGFFCAGLKSAVVRTHNIAHTSMQTVPSYRSRATQSSTRSDEEEFPPKAKGMMQGVQNRRGLPMPAPESSILSSGTVSNIQNNWPILNKSLAKRFAANGVESHTHLNSRPSLSLCVKCQSSSSLHQPSMKGLHLRNGPSSQQSVQNLRCVYPCADDDGGCDFHDTQHTPSKSNASDDCSCNACKSDVSSHCRTSQGNGIKESLMRDSAVESVSRDGCRSPEDDVLQFYDALSRFEMPIFIESHARALQDCKLKFQGGPAPTQILTCDERSSLEAHLPCIREGEILAFDAEKEGHVKVFGRDQSEGSGKEGPVVQRSCGSNSHNEDCVRARRIHDAHSASSNLYRKNPPHDNKKSLENEGHVKVLGRDQSEGSGKEGPVFQQNCGSNFHNEDCVGVRPIHDAHSASSNLYRKNPPHDHKKSLSSPILGWPLGIAGLQAGTRKAPPQEPKHIRDECAVSTKLQFATIAEVAQSHDDENMNNEGTNKRNNRVANTMILSDVLSPPAPPSPSASSWLGKALALKASRSSPLVALQQEEKVVSAKKKLEFTLPSVGKKAVRWEEVVKGSQMHP